jgi:signal transduction histidine kinase/DNA-binding response OmpR family regulator
VSKKRVLVVDDEPIVRRAVSDYLAEWGYETTMAANGAEGLARARSEQFHVALVDLRMPHIDGLQVITELHTEHPNLPVVVVSGTGVLTDIIEAMRRGAWDYITKPIQDMDEVVVVVERVLEKAHLIAERDRYQSEIEQLNRSLEAEVARQVQDLKVQNLELTALSQVSYAISSSLDLDTILGRAIDAAITALNADGGVIRLLNPDTGQLEIAIARGLPEAYLASAQSIPIGQGLVGQVAYSGHPQVEHDVSRDPCLATLAQMADLGSYLCVPLRAGDEMALLLSNPNGKPTLAEQPSDQNAPVLGTLGIATRAKREFATHEIDLLAAIGNQVGVTVARARYAADLKQANIQLERANAELRRLDVLREQFIQNVAHELRTPLALIHGYVEMLAPGDLNPEEQRLALNVTSRHVQRLVDLVEAITTLQDLSSQPLRLEKIKPTELLQTACHMTGQKALSAGVKLRHVCPPELPPFRGDFTRLAQALHQLLDNACKFSPKGSTATIAAQLAPEQDALCISVVDQGIGIPSEEHRRIFERFYQVDGTTTRRYGGAGLGLALVKEVVEAHGGTITIQSVPGEGSKFDLILPILQ